MVQWLRLHASTAGSVGSILVGEVRSCMMQKAARKKFKKIYFAHNGHFNINFYFKMNTSKYYLC